MDWYAGEAGSAAVAGYSAAAETSWMAPTLVAGEDVTTSVMYGNAYGIAASSMEGGMIQGAAGGFTSGLLASNGNFNAGLRGAASGAIFGGLNGFYGDQWSAGRLAANAIAGGISARIQGTDFVTGFERSFVTGAAQWGYTSNVGYSPNALPGWNQPDGVSQNYEYNSLGQQYSDSWGENVIGFNKGLTGNSWSDLGTQGDIVSRILITYQV